MAYQRESSLLCVVDENQRQGMSAFQEDECVVAREHCTIMTAIVLRLLQSSLIQYYIIADTILCTAWANCSACSLSICDGAGATKDARFCSQIKPSWSKTWYRLGRAFYEKEDWLRASSAFSSARQAEGFSPELEIWHQVSQLRALARVKSTYQISRKRNINFDMARQRSNECDIYGHDASNEMHSVVHLHERITSRRRAALEWTARRNGKNFKRIQSMWSPGLQCANQSSRPGAVRTWERNGSFLAVAFYLHQVASAEDARLVATGISNLQYYLDTAVALIDHYLRFDISRSYPRFILGPCSYPSNEIVSFRKNTKSIINFLPCASLFVSRMTVANRDESTRIAGCTNSRQIVSLGQSRQTWGMHHPSSHRQDSRPHPFSYILSVEPGLLNDGLLRSGILPLVRRARRESCVSCPYVVPCRIRMMVTPCFTSTTLSGLCDSMNSPHNPTCSETVNVDDSFMDIEQLAAPALCFEAELSAIDIEDAIPNSFTRVCRFVARRSGYLNSIIFWLDFDVWPFDLAFQIEGSAVGLPGSKYDYSESWQSQSRSDCKHFRSVQSLEERQALQWIYPVRVDAGQCINIRFSHNSTRLSFQTILKEIPHSSNSLNSYLRWQIEAALGQSRDVLFTREFKHTVETIKSVVLKNTTQNASSLLLDLGLISALPAQMATFCGADEAYRIERRSSNGLLLRQIALKRHIQRYQPLIKGIDDVKLGTDVPRRCDVLLMQKLNIKQTLSYLMHADYSFLKREAVVVPRLIRICALPIDIAKAKVAIRESMLGIDSKLLSSVCGVDSELDSTRESIEVFRYDFSDRLHCKERFYEFYYEGSFIANSNGIVNAVLFWSDTNQRDSIGSRRRDAYLEGQALLFPSMLYQITPEIELTKGEAASIRVTHDDSELSCLVSRSDFGSIETKWTPFDHDSFHTYHQIKALSTQTKARVCMEERILARVAEVVLSITTDPARFASDGLYICSGAFVDATMFL